MTIDYFSKTGWGPYRYHRKGEHFVGTEPSVLKYHIVSCHWQFIQLEGKISSASDAIFS